MISNADLTTPVLGFTGRNDRAVCLQVPVQYTHGPKAFCDFDIHHCTDAPGMMAICVREVGANGWIETVRESVRFPASMLAELLARRKPTPEEQAAWEEADWHAIQLAGLGNE